MVYDGEAIGGLGVVLHRLHILAYLGVEVLLFFFQAEDGIRDIGVTGVQTCALPICWLGRPAAGADRPIIEGELRVRPHCLGATVATGTGAAVGPLPTRVRRRGGPGWAPGSGRGSDPAHQRCAAATGGGCRRALEHITLHPQLGPIRSAWISGAYNGGRVTGSMRTGTICPADCWAKAARSSAPPNPEAK